MSNVLNFRLHLGRWRDKNFLNGGSQRAFVAVVQSTDAWRYHPILYGYPPTISGTTELHHEGGSVNVSPDQIIGNLKGAFMGTFEVNKERWGAFTDLMYLNVNGCASDSRDIAIGGA